MTVKANMGNQSIVSGKFWAQKKDLNRVALEHFEIDILEHGWVLHEISEVPNTFRAIR